MIFGAITNSWRQQLEGQDLAVLVQEAQTRGIRMKLSISSHRQFNGFLLLAQALPQYLGGGLSFS
jgi:hypothetical protein